VAPEQPGEVVDLATAALPPDVRRGSATPSLDEILMKLAFSTLGCPNWELDQIVATAQRLGYDGVELRAVGGSLDLLDRPEFRSGRLQAARALFVESNLEICCVDTSCAFHSPSREERSAQVESALRHGELAAELGAPSIRVFPDKIQPGATRDETRDYICECLRQVAERMPREVCVALETHGDFARTEATVEIVTLVNHPRLKVIWDVANSVAAGDSIDGAGRMVQRFLSHIHLRDARPVSRSEHWLPVLAGSGEVSFAETVAVIEGLNYDGYVSFEWEKYWHPEIEEPEVALPDFINAIRKLNEVRRHDPPATARWY
jgi:sugar phosphate isomerase/epimerase